MIVPSAPVVSSNLLPSGFVTSNTAFFKTIELSSASTLINLILFAMLPVPVPPESSDWWLPWVVAS